MNRRRYLGVLTAATGVVTVGSGTGAFSTAESGDRSMSVDVVDDSRALLGLQPNEKYSTVFTDEDGKLTVSLGGSQGQPGVNPASAYRVGMVRSQSLRSLTPSPRESILPDDESSPTDDPAFKIANQSTHTQDVNLTFGKMEGSGDLRMYLQFAANWSDDKHQLLITPESDQSTRTFVDVPPGEYVAASLIVDATDADRNDFLSFSMQVAAGDL